uniref:Uncharacterized protein n=1 Tax=Anopheles culicifacies TaxID=139723 RepID=A0A182LWZ1_9DIPT
MKSLNITVNVEESFTQATIRLRPPSSTQSLTNANGKSKTTNDSCNLEASGSTSTKPSSSALVTAIVTTDDLGDEDVGETKITSNDAKELQVTATIRLKPKGSTSKVTEKERRRESGTSSTERRSVMSDSNVIATSKASTSTSIRSVRQKHDDDELEEEETRNKRNSFHAYHTVDTNSDKIVNNGNEHEEEKEALAVNGVGHASNASVLSAAHSEYNESDKECNVDQAMNLRHSGDLHKNVKPLRIYHDQSTTEKDSSGTSSSRLSSSYKPSYERVSDVTDSTRSSKEGKIYGDISSSEHGIGSEHLPKRSSDYANHALYM